MDGRDPTWSENWRSSNFLTKKIASYGCHKNSWRWSNLPWKEAEFCFHKTGWRWFNFLWKNLILVATKPTGGGPTSAKNSRFCDDQIDWETSRDLVKNTWWHHQEHGWRWSGFLWKLAGFNRHNKAWKSPHRLKPPAPARQPRSLW